MGGIRPLRGLETAVRASLFAQLCAAVFYYRLRRQAQHLRKRRLRFARSASLTVPLDPTHTHLFELRSHRRDRSRRVGWLRPWGHLERPKRGRDKIRPSYCTETQGLRDKTEWREKKGEMIPSPEGHNTNPPNS